MKAERSPLVDDFETLLEELGEAVCRVCGCTDEDPCPGGCLWAEPDLCSRCVRAAADEDA